MFGERPDRLIAGCKIELVRFHDREAEASDFTEKTFYGKRQDGRPMHGRVMILMS